MRRKEIDPTAIFQRRRGAAAITGLSDKYIYEGCKNGTIPAIKCGSDWLINMPLFLEQLNEASRVKSNVN